MKYKKGKKQIRKNNRKKVNFLVIFQKLQIIKRIRIKRKKRKNQKRKDFSIGDMKWMSNLSFLAVNILNN